MSPKNGAIRIALLYALVGFVWIFISDKLLLHLWGHISPHAYNFINIFKGFAYVILTAWLLYALIKKQHLETIEAEKQYRSFFIDNPDPMWIYEVDTLRFVGVNDAAIAHYGFSKQEFLSMTVLDIRPDSAIEDVKNTVANRQTKRHDAGIWIHRKKDGTIIHVHITSQILNGDGKIIVLAKDVTETLMTEKKLKAAYDGLQLLNKDLVNQQKQLSDIQQLAQLGGWEYFPQTGNMVCSDEIYYILDFAWPGEPSPLENLIKHVHANDKELFEKHVDAMRNEGKSFSQIFRIKDDHGRLKYLYMIANDGERSGPSFRIRGTLQDITQSKILEEQKKLYLLRLENTLNSISDAFCVLDDNWVVRAVNTMFANLAEIPKEEIINHRITEFWPTIGPGDVFYEHLTRAIAKRETLRFEFFARTKRWLRVVAYPTAEGVAFYFTDITESKEKDIQLQRALDRYNLVARATEDMFYEFDIRNNRLTYSQGMDGIPNPAFINEKDPTKAWFNIIHPDDLPRMMEANQKSLREHSQRYECEYRIDFGNHNYRYVSDKAYIQYENGEPVQMVGAIRDINDLKKTAEENKLLSRVISHVTNKIMITDSNMKVLWVNKAFEEVSGYTLKEMFNGYPQDFIGGPNPNPTLTKDISDRSEKQEVFSKELNFYRRDGSFSWVKGDFTPLYNDGHEFIGYIIIYANINELKEKQASLEAQNATLREIAWLESHEMRRPLSSILGLVELIKGSVDEAEKKYLFELLDTSAKDLDTMVMKISTKIHESMAQERK